MRRERRGSAGSRVPEPGSKGAPDETTEGSDARPAGRDPHGRKLVTRLGRSGVGPGAGEEDIVRVKVPVQQEGGDDAEATRHPTLRENDETGAHN